MKYVYIKTKDGLVRAEFRWQSEKGPWTLVRLNDRLRAVPNRCIRKPSSLGELI